MRPHGPITLALLLALAAPHAAGAESWRSYVNARFGFAIDYPADLLRMQPPPANDDGRAFVGAGGSIRATASGSHNVLNASADDLYRDALREFGAPNVTYRRRADRWYVVSGRRDGRIFYEYAAIATKGDGEVIGRFRIVYPAAMQPRLGPVVTRMQRSFAASFRRMPAAR